MAMCGDAEGRSVITRTYAAVPERPAMRPALASTAMASSADGYQLYGHGAADGDCSESSTESEDSDLEGVYAFGGTREVTIRSSDAGGHSLESPSRKKLQQARKDHGRIAELTAQKKDAIVREDFVVAQRIKLELDALEFDALQTKARLTKLDAQKGTAVAREDFPAAQQIKLEIDALRESNAGKTMDLPQPAPERVDANVVRQAAVVVSSELVQEAPMPAAEIQEAPMPAAEIQEVPRPAAEIQEAPRAAAAMQEGQRAHTELREAKREDATMCDAPATIEMQQTPTSAAGVAESEDHPPTMQRSKCSVCNHKKCACPRDAPAARNGSESHAESLQENVAATANTDGVASWAKPSSICNSTREPAEAIAACLPERLGSHRASDSRELDRQRLEAPRQPALLGQKPSKQRTTGGRKAGFGDFSRIARSPRSGTPVPTGARTRVQKPPDATVGIAGYSAAASLKSSGGNQLPLVPGGWGDSLTSQRLPGKRRQPRLG